MSAFVVDAKTMDLAVEAILGRSRYGMIVPGCCGISTEAKTRATGTAIGRKLFALNLFSVQERYPDCVANPDATPGPADAVNVAATYVFDGYCGPGLASTSDLVKGVRALHCLEYQSCEGGANLTPSYKSLEAAIALLSEHIVRQLPEYGA